jgi:diadenosine tetraphosphate (Ap4A) HIT family hydrolase
MATIFTRIIAGEIPGTFVHRDDQCVVFMSINPLAHGHALRLGLLLAAVLVHLPRLEVVVLMEKEEKMRLVKIYKIKHRLLIILIER